jgi:hypothetical protein
VDDLGATGRRTTPFAADEGIGSRRELLGALRRIAVHLETAEVLELRADRSASPALATVLRERAAQRRRTAGRLRAGLDRARMETISGMAGSGRRPPTLPITS